MAEPKIMSLMEKIVSLCKRRGFIFQSSEIYGGINGFWDYGPLGAELKRNVKDYWWRCMTQQREDVVGLEATIIMHPKIWEASGHVETFSDPMVDCLLDQEALSGRPDRAAERDRLSLHRARTIAATGKRSTKSLIRFCCRRETVRIARGKSARQFYQQRGIADAATPGRTNRSR